MPDCEPRSGVNDPERGEPLDRQHSQDNERDSSGLHDSSSFFSLLRRPRQLSGRGARRMSYYQQRLPVT